MVVVDRFTKIAYFIGQPRNFDRKGGHQCFPTGSLETPQFTHGNHIRHGYKILGRILGLPLHAARDKKKNVRSVPPTNGGSDGKNQPSAGRLLKKFCQL